MAIIKNKGHHILEELFLFKGSFICFYNLFTYLFPSSALPAGVVEYADDISNER